MKFEAILNYISDDELSILSAQTKVDYQVKKLNGSVIFKLILYSMLEYGKPSLRVLEECFHSPEFILLANKNKIKAKYNSLSDRISSINAVYFEKIFELLFDKFHSELKEENAIQKYDTTMVAVSSKLVHWGMKIGSKTDKKQIKFTVGMHGSLPCDFKIYTGQKYLCEDLTIPEVIYNYRYNKSSIVTFDRGVQSRKTFATLNKANILFVTRIKTNATYKTLKSNNIKSFKNSSSVLLTEDLEVNFIEHSTKKPIPVSFRFIRGYIKSSNEEICFVTNNFELDAYDIAELYRKRWEIEVFFKFIKQELNFSHLLNRNLNGVKVMVYITLILAMLIIVYKKKNNLSGYKIVKMKISNELQKSLIKEIVILSGGDPMKIAYIIDD